MQQCFIRQEYGAINSLEDKNPYFHVVERCGSLVLASRLFLSYAPMILANTGGNSDGSAYPIRENIDRKRFLLFFIGTNVPGVWLWYCYRDVSQ